VFCLKSEKSEDGVGHTRCWDLLSWVEIGSGELRENLFIFSTVIIPRARLSKIERNRYSMSFKLFSACLAAKIYSDWFCGVVLGCDLGEKGEEW
jgi:hypothetical protein